MAKPPQPWEFRSKPAWQRLIIMLGGVTVNFVLGIFIYMMMFTTWGDDYVGIHDVKNGFAVVDSFKSLGFQDGDKILKVNGEEPFNVLSVNKHLFLRDVNKIEVTHINGQNETINLPEDIGLTMWQNGDMEPFTPRYSAIIDSVLPDTPASKSGLLKGDIVTAVDNQQVVYWDEFTSLIRNNIDANEMQITVKRDGELKTIAVSPVDNQLGISTRSYNNDINVNHKDYTFSESIGKGWSKAYWTLKDYIGQFKYVFTKKGATSLGGFITIGSIFPATWNWQAFWSITALLSIMLGFMNLLPIPALDGGHVVFTLYEIISGRKPSDKFLEYAQITGFVILMALLLFANGNDIYKWITGQI